MTDLTSDFIGVKSPNPFWLASAPPTDKAYNVNRAFEAGWGGVVWKTLGEDPHPVNVSSRYSPHHDMYGNLIGINNIELISDRPLAVNLQEIREVKRNWPDRAMVVSLMVPCNEDSWRNILRQVEDTGADAIELNFGCPHGMPERGMGSAVGQVPEYVEMVANWCKHYSSLPVIVKLTPNISNILHPATAAKKGGADAVSLINTINSITSIDLDTMVGAPAVGGKVTSGGYCGPAVKPIALNMVGQIARNPATHGLPISGIGGITTWRDAAEFMVLGAGNVQVCTAAMIYGFNIIDELTDGLSQWMASKGFKTLNDFVGKAIPNLTDWKYLDLNYKTLARIDPDLCIGCGRCFASCEDTSHQAIKAAEHNHQRVYEVIDENCVGCNLCQITCPVTDCITMEPQPVNQPYLNWTQHPNNPMREVTTEEA
ncbi:NAD-dependent dihydropyrimidine dehydrogenase subunit PreA [Spartinivicinus poritis]|uniref:dihydrouracil dehydrogenase (NAD(+)) n=1 Tax=Spartinivicinus poritis TaxID=2994640 RepID=A0ABT5U518_9GAMM|nr:NAD-dependent dihydropyrimidine dehydrogenase subunit PreA [Spartinivicinus sp. A2-2]MDE1460647.1 NAD-dependent dihydropyrimidine dehydrogenase subunit PreA [Spartinivicinus sp. A2-2]